jgi:hypothetical protein
MSPTSYLQRLQNQLFRNVQRYQFNTDTAAVDRNLTRSGLNDDERALDASFLRGLAADSLANEDVTDTAIGQSSNHVNRNEAGRSAETALEIDDSDSDDDVVEVVAVEAMM